MKMRTLLQGMVLIGGICANPVSHAEDIIYQTSFEAVDFPAAPLTDSAIWRNLSSGSGATAEIVTASNPEGLGPAEGEQQLRLLRPTSQDNPYARLAFLPLANGLKEPFDVSFKIAAIPHSPYFVAQAVVADTSTGSAGALVGLAYRERNGKKTLYAYGVDKSEYRDIGTVGSDLELNTFYEFRLHIEPDAQKYSVEVRRDGEVVGRLEGLQIKGTVEQFNAFGIRMAGGTKDDVLFLDDLKIVRP